MKCTPIVRENLTIGGAIFIGNSSKAEKLLAVRRYLECEGFFKRIGDLIGT